MLIILTIQTRKMKTSNVLAPVALLILTTPAQANIGQGAKLAFDLFGEGIGSLFVHIFGGKRDVSSIDGHIIRRDPPPGVPAFEYERCRNDISGVSVTATSPGPGCKCNLPVSARNRLLCFEPNLFQRSNLSEFQPAA